MAAHGIEHEQKPNEFLPHPLCGGHASATPATRPRQRKARRRLGPVLPPDPPLLRTRPTRGRAKGPAKHAGPRAGPMTTGMLPSKARIKGYVHRGDRHAPPPGKLNAWGAGGDSAHITCEARVTTLVTLRKCTLGNKREIKTLKFVLASTKGFGGGLGLDQALQERHGSDFFLLPPGVLVS